MSVFSKIKNSISPRKRAIIKSMILSIPERFHGLDLNNFNIQTNNKYKFELRRAVHRLEKSLSFNPRRPAGGINISEEIIELLELNRKNKFADEFTLTWSYAVLNDQSNQLKADLRNPEAKDTEKIESLISKIENHIQINASAARSSLLKPISENNLEYDDLLSFVRSRHSIRSFTKDLINREALLKAIEIAKRTPSACNKQSVTVSILQGQELIHKALKIQGGLVGYENAISNLAVVSSTREAFPGFHEKHTVFTEGALFGMNFIWGLHAQGIATVVLNWTGAQSKAKSLNKLLNLNYLYQPVFLIAFGYASENVLVPGSPRMKPEDYLNIL